MPDISQPMTKRPCEEIMDLETDSEDESHGCSQKYQLRGDYVKKLKAKSGSQTTNLSAMADDDDTAVDIATPDLSAMADDDDNYTKKRERMMVKSEAWLKWLWTNYNHKDVADHQWPDEK
jgi:hypothetical protein